jgi:hypothetical protein
MIILGLAAGALLNFVIQGSVYNDLKSSFSDVFLIILLPPIIFESAISMESVICLFYNHQRKCFLRTLAQSLALH